MTVLSRLVLLAAVLVAVIGAAGVVGAYVVAHAAGHHPKGFVESPQQADKREARENQPHVKAVHPKRDPALVMSVRQLLSVEPFFVADLRSQVPGVVRYVLKDIHDPVKRGDVLVAIDVPDLEQDLREKEATVLQRLQDVRVARAQAENAGDMVDVYQELIAQRQAEKGQAEATRDYRKKRFERFSKLGGRDVTQEGIIEEEERDYRAAEFGVQAAAVAIRKATAEFHEKQSAHRIAEADIELKQTLVEVARRNRDKARALLDYAQIAAPFNGVVLRRNVDPGAFVQNASTGQSEPLLTVGRTDIVTLVMKVPDNVAPYVTVDTEAVIQIDELPGVEIRGKVTRFAPSILNKDRTMRVEVDLYNDGSEKYHRFVARAVGSRLAGLAADSPLGLSALLAGGRDVWNRETKSDRDPLPTFPVVSGRQTAPQLIPGMSGYMRLNLHHFSNAYLLPSSAVFTRGGKPYLLQVEEGVTHLLPVHVQYDDGKLAKVAVIEQEAMPSHGQPEVLRELTGHEVILLNRQEEVGEGQSVQVTLDNW
jgi:multidrug resistance efflux pump